MLSIVKTLGKALGWVLVAITATSTGVLVAVMMMDFIARTYLNK